ncbi:MAG: hypothetical protein ACRCWW_08265 [Scandinavium sp.]|uniref:hypothetical protein n=1 Tax=Scandinavium sp. TaxID=2830653 RepID=UPI003F2DF5FD
MDIDENQLWQNFRGTLKSLLDEADITQEQRDFIFHNLEDSERDNVIDINRKIPD